MAVPTDKELEKLSNRFVRVRLIQMGGVDLSMFQFDPFLSWSLFFVNADKTIYGRFGRAHPSTKRNKKDSNPNHTLDGMKAALRKALDVHAAYVKDPKKLAAALAGKTGPVPRWKFAEKTPAALKYGRLKRVADGEEAGCVHCHEVHRTAIDSMYMTKKRLPDNMLWMYPRPHLLGLTMDNRRCASVVRVTAESVAAKAGLRAGDDLATLNGQPLVSIADLQWVLHNFPDAGGPLPVEVVREKQTIKLSMKLASGWRRQEDFVWRYRMAGYASWLWTGAGYKDGPKGIVVDHLSPNWWKKPNKEGRRKLKRGDVIVGVDGKKGMDRSGFLAYLMRDKKLGTKLKLDVLRGGKTVEVSFKMPKKQPEVQGY